MKKFLKILLSLAACLAIIVSLSNVATVNAATHTHAFESGRCSCGTLRLEGESADMSNVKSSDNDQQGTLIEDVATASGGKSFGNWSLAGNYVVWKFSLDKDTTASVTLSLASCGSGTTLSESHAIIVNGVTAVWSTEKIPAIVGQNWYDFKEYSTNPVSFKKGDNKIVLKNVNGYPSNIDYIDVGFSSDITVGEHSHECSKVCEVCKGCLDDKCTETACATKCSCVRHVHEFVKNRCSCGALKIEAETATIEGTPVNYDKSVESDQFVLSGTSASGGGYVGNWGSTDNVMTFQFNVSKAQDVSIEIVFAPCKVGTTWVLPTEGNRDDKGTGIMWPFEVRVNTSYEDSNVVALFEKSTLPSFDGKNYFNWNTVKTQTVHLKEGTNYIQIESWDYYYANFDYIIVGVSDDTEVTIPEVVDVVKPAVTLSVEEKEYKPGEEISFTVSVTDNISPVDKIKVETKVYLNYNRDSQEEIAVSGGKFTPTEIGRYTIVVTATDEAGNVSTKTRALTVEDDGSAPVTPDDPDKPTDDPSTSGGDNGNAKEDEKTGGLFSAIGNWEPVAGWPLKVFAWNTMWIPFCIVVVLAGGGYFLAIWLFGRMKLTDAEKEYVEKSSKELKKVDRKVRKEQLNKQSKRVKRVVSWNITSKYIWTSVVAVVLVISMIATPVLTTTMPYIKEALFPTNALSPDSEAAKLAIGEAKENVVEIESEGITLLKNEEEDGEPVLPLDPTSDKDKKINIFGSSAFGMLYGGGGSGVFVTNAISYGNELIATRLEDALETEGFEYNKNLYNLVANYFESKTYKITETSYDIQCQNNVFGGNTKDDKGNILIDETRFPYDNEPEASAYEKTYGGLDGKTLLEDAKAYSDIALYAVSRAGSEDGDLTYTNTLLTDREKAMLDLLKANFKRVIVIINSSNTMELGALDADGIDSVLWVGHPGLTGNTAVAQVISGKINPSGKMVDTWVYSGNDNPASLMFGHEGTEYYSNKNTAYQVYYEGVYLGYRYYVTRALTDSTYKYEDHVQWSFGYGLSYTTFEKHITECIIDPETDKVSVQVAVTNTGAVAGKEVVQIYFNAPYTGTVEKPYYELAGFSKTDVIEPGETYYARVEFAFSDMASWYSAYNGGTGAYLLEKGDYTISLRDNVWDLTKDENLDDDFVNEHVYNLIDDRAITTDPVTGNTVTTRFADVEYGPNDEKVTYLSRSDWAGTFPTADKINRTASSAVKNSSAIKSYTDNQISDKDTSEYVQGVDYGLKLSDFKGLGINDTLEIYGETYTWDDLVDQMTVSDMCTLVDSRFMGTVKIDSVAKPEMGDDDGPASVSIYGVGYPSEVVVASTWNPDMGYLLGYSLGKEGASMGMSGWYAPGLNIHRSAAGGRNFEYYSEDPLISGLMGAATVKGAAKFGVYTYIKHFVLNDQETERRTIQVWANEQSMREIYMRAFEITIKESGSLGIMSSFNFLGTTWSGGSKALMTDVLRTEWGFEGVAVTDWVNAGTMPVSSGLRAGNDLWLGKNTSYSATAAYKETPDDVHYLLRQACKRILVAAANSNAVWTEEDYKAVGIDNPPKVNHEALEGYH